MTRLLFTILCAVYCLPTMAQSEWQVRLMPQVAFGAKNTLQRPNDAGGTRFSLDRDFDRKNDAVFSPRIEVEYNYRRHHVIATAALLRNRFNGTATENINYNGTLFETGTNIETNYRFNTYRLGYRYRLVDRPRIVFDLGATLLVRDAVISLENESQRSSFYNVGVAPLLSYYLEWRATDRLSLLTYGDAFAVKAGRAEDIFAGLQYRFSPLVSGLAGYRLLEGGSDVDKIYTMATFHYLSLGIGLHF